MRIFMDRFRKNCSDCFSPAVIVAVIICFLVMNDTGKAAALRHLAAVFAVSFFMRAYLPTHVLSFSDNGFGMSFGLGLFLCFFPAWTLSATGVCEYSDPVIFGSFIILAILGIVIRRYVIRRPYITREEFKASLNGFAAFAVIFLAFFWMIGFNPIVDPGTENYMDFGFIRTIFRQKAAVPKDIWFSGQTLNYYYLGQSICVYLIRLGKNVPEYGYNMMLATFAGMVFLMSYELVSAVVSALLPSFDKKSGTARASGIVGAAIAAFGANPHWLIYGIIYPILEKLAGNPEVSKYWFPDGTVYIHTSAGDPDNGKNEFPAYSVILGDLHAHVINLMFVLPLLAILFDLCLAEDEEGRKKLGKLYSLTLISMLLGYYKGSNYWDFAIYFVVTGALIVFCDIKRLGATVQAFGGIALKAVFVTVISLVTPLAFTLHFVKMESGIKICETHTPISKLMVLWLIPVAVTVCLIIWLYSKKRAESGIDKTCQAALLAFCLCTIGLIAVPEVVYVKDIYGGDNNRFNTMFKLTYQAYVLFALIIGIAFGVAVFEAIRKGEGERRAKRAAILIAVYAVLSAAYTGYASRQWFGQVWDPSQRVGISSLEDLRGDPTYGFEMEAYDVLAKDDGRVINIVEVAGNSYTHNDALSVYSGACTPVGWYVHEWMWHNDPDPVNKRAEDVATFYASGNEDYCRDFLKRYDIDYIFVGPAEVCRYPVVQEGFANLGTSVADTNWQGCRLSLIKVDKSRL